MSWEINPMGSHWTCHRWRNYIGFLKVNLICFSEALVICRSQFSHQLLPSHHQPLHSWYLKWPTHIGLLLWLLQYYPQWYCQSPSPPEECMKIFSGNHLTSSGQCHVAVAGRECQTALKKLCLERWSPAEGTEICKETADIWRQKKSQTSEAVASA